MATDPARVVEHPRVEPGSAVALAWRDPRDRLGFADKAEGRARTEDLRLELDDLHDHLWAEARRGLILVLQGMDASGKDGAIRKVLSGLNPQGCSVANFKEPSAIDLEHDYLARVHAAEPARGILGVWNRSHYEDVVTARVLGVIDDDQCRKRFRHLREFERLLRDEGFTMVKVFLHLSKEEQRVRLQARIDEPTKNWKFRRGDLETRAHWDEYQERYELAITETTTDWSPWYVVPADHKWVRDVAVVSLLVHVLRELDPEIPPPEEGLEGLVVE